MKKLLTLATVALVAANAFAEAAYSYDDADRLNYAVSVPSGETVEISSGAIALLNANSVTNFIKRGDGTLVVGSVLDSYTGSVRVEDGIYRMAPSKTDNTACGVRSGGGDIVVIDGATLSIRPTVANTSLAGKKIVFGFRPEHIKLGSHENAYQVTCNVELTEMLGDNTNVYVTAGKDQAILKVDSHDTPETDKDITFSIPYENVYLFDGETEKVIKD